MRKVHLLWQATGSSNDKLLSLHLEKSSAIRAKREQENKLIGAVRAADVTDFYLTERYVIED